MRYVVGEANKLAVGTVGVVATSKDVLVFARLADTDNSGVYIHPGVEQAQFENVVTVGTAKTSTYG